MPRDSRPQELPRAGARWSRVGAPLLALTSVVGLVLGVLLGWLVFAPSHPGDHSAEAGFARDMSEHHAQAVEMSLLATARSESPDIQVLAYDVATSQANQIGQMEAWLRAWDLPTARPEGRMAWMEGHDVHEGHGAGGEGAPMPGMATDEQMEQLRAAEGQEAEVLFLQLMTTHHRAGVDMAQAAVDLTEHPEVDRLASAMVAAQESELDLMVDLLAARDADVPAQH